MLSVVDVTTLACVGIWNTCSWSTPGLIARTSTTYVLEYDLQVVLVLGVRPVRSVAESAATARFARPCLRLIFDDGWKALAKGARRISFRCEPDEVFSSAKHTDERRHANCIALSYVQYRHHNSVHVYNGQPLLHPTSISYVIVMRE